MKGLSMPDPMSPQSFNAVAEWIHNERRDRGLRRQSKGIEQMWKEVDRQVAMTPLRRTLAPGDDSQNTWMSSIELPLQFNTLEVILADARSLKFPRGTSWYEPSAYLSDAYLERWEARREKRGIIGKKPVPLQMDQETADILIKAAIDHYHRQYDFRQAVNLFDAESVKYGTSVVRIHPVVFSKFDQPRMIRSREIEGPAWTATSIKHLYLDDNVSQVTHEGVHVAPSHIREYWQSHKALMIAAQKGGPERGWRKAEIAKLIPFDQQERKGTVQLLELEGDAVVPRSRDSIFMENVIVTVGVGQGEPRVVRFRKSKVPFRTYVIGNYIRTEIDSPYGTSPLMKGQPVSEAATEATNQLMDAGALNVLPPMFYDGNDPTLATGVDFYPGSQSGIDNPDRIKFERPSDIAAMTVTLQVLLKLYEDLTGVNDPRRGSGLKSHTTAGAAEIEAGKGIARTEDFVSDQNIGPMTTGLSMDYVMIKDMMELQPVSVDQPPLDGWVEIGKNDLADDVNLKVHGAAGVFEERQKFDRFVQAVNVAGQVIAQAAALNIPVPQDYQAIITEIYARAGIENLAKFIGTADAASAGAAIESAVPPGGEGANGAQSPALAAG